MNPLASRKKLLIAESDLNRARLVQEWQSLTSTAQALADQARTVRSLASAAATLVAGLTSLHRKKPAPVVEKTSWLRTILKGAGQISNFLQALRPAGPAKSDK